MCPDLRIIDQPLCGSREGDPGRLQQEGDAALEEKSAQEPCSLVMTKCGACGGGFTIINNDTDWLRGRAQQGNVRQQDARWAA
jgi:hypothetical protein